MEYWSQGQWWGFQHPLGVLLASFCMVVTLEIWSYVALSQVQNARKRHSAAQTVMGTPEGTRKSCSKVGWVKRTPLFGILEAFWYAEHLEIWMLSTIFSQLRGIQGWSRPRTVPQLNTVTPFWVVQVAPKPSHMLSSWRSNTNITEAKVRL